MLLASLVFTALAALVHVYIFVLESLRWTAENWTDDSLANLGADYGN